MWNGAFSPDFTKRKGCEHGSVAVFFGEPEFGFVPVYVEFNHTCNGKPVPSNDKTYTYELELDNFDEAMNEDVADLVSELDKMSSSEKLKWINQNLAS